MLIKKLSLINKGIMVRFYLVLRWSNPRIWLTHLARGRRRSREREAPARGPVRRRRRSEDVGHDAVTPARGPGGEAPTDLGRSARSPTYAPADAAVRFWRGRRRRKVLEVLDGLGRNGGRTEDLSGRPHLMRFLG